MLRRLKPLCVWLFLAPSREGGRGFGGHTQLCFLLVTDTLRYSTGLSGSVWAWALPSHGRDGCGLDHPDSHPPAAVP